MRVLGANQCGFSIILILKGIMMFLESKSPCVLLNKNVNFHKYETESKMENLPHSFREMNLLLRHMQEWQIKSKTVMSWSSQKKKEGTFCAIYFVRKEFSLIFVF